MIFAVIGILKQPPPPPQPGFESALNEHFAQHVPRLVTGGYLRGRDGERIGLLGLLEAETFDQAQAFLDHSPYSVGGHYDHVHVAAFDVEVGVPR